MVDALAVIVPVLLQCSLKQYCVHLFLADTDTDWRCETCKTRSERRAWTAIKLVSFPFAYTEERQLSADFLKISLLHTHRVQACNRCVPTKPNFRVETKRTVSWPETDGRTRTNNRTLNPTTQKRLLPSTPAWRLKGLRCKHCYIVFYKKVKKKKPQHCCQAVHQGYFAQPAGCLAWVLSRSSAQRSQSSC